ncbi:MAG: hypothetical protein JWM21_1900 [Acidobacteria bacterium]|nr:hypothetical protein [Acidobacteriota bacterium]
MATSFATTIKPYFSENDRNSMNNADHTGGFTLDLWSAADVKKYFSAIKDAIDSQSMPPGGWPAAKITAFDADFDAWQAGGYQA